MATKKQTDQKRQRAWREVDTYTSALKSLVASKRHMALAEYDERFAKVSAALDAALLVLESCPTWSETQIARKAVRS